MMEKGSQRSGTDPLTGIKATASTGASDNPINAHERTIAYPYGDIQYACIFPVLEPINCADPTVTACDCDQGTSADNPLCGPNPRTSTRTTCRGGRSRTSPRRTRASRTWR